MTIQCRRCENDDDFAKASLFLLAHKRDLHPAYTTLEMVTLIYSYVTQGNLVYVLDDERRVVGVGAYYCGTPEQEFQDKDIALIDVAIFDKARRGSRAFLQGLQFLIDTIMERHPEVQVLQLAALADNPYLCRLYAKFAVAGPTREGTHGKEIVFSGKIVDIRDTLSKFNRL